MRIHNSCHSVAPIFSAASHALLCLVVMGMIVGCSGEEANNLANSTADTGSGGDTLSFVGTDGSNLINDIAAVALDEGSVEDTASEDVQPDVEEDIAPEVVCEPLCEDKECGPDGCGGECGECAEFKICSNKGECQPDPQAGCAGLSLAEDWEGTFEGDYTISAAAFGLVEIPAAEGPTEGDIAFSIKCLNSKLIISGKATGLASSENPFQLDMAGDFDPLTGIFDGKVPAGSVTVTSSLNTVFEFQGVIPGTLQEDGTLAGTYEIDAVKATAPILGEIDISSTPAESSGTWIASPVN